MASFVSGAIVAAFLIVAFRTPQQPSSLMFARAFASKYHNRSIPAAAIATIFTRSIGRSGNRSRCCSRTMSNESISKDAYMHFSRFKILDGCIFYKSEHTYAFVNLRPIVDGHVLVTSNRVVAKTKDLTSEEYNDLWNTVRLVQGMLERKHAQQSGNDGEDNADGVVVDFNIAIQDGKNAGQSVPHVHVHILPRYGVDRYANSDTIYTELETWRPKPKTEDESKNSKPQSKVLDVPDDSQRGDRTIEQMIQEAGQYRSFLLTLIE